MPQDDYLLLLGEIKGRLDLVIANQVTHREEMKQEFKLLDARVDGIDARLQSVEKDNVKSAMVAGGVISVGMAIIIETAKRKLGL